MHVQINTDSGIEGDNALTQQIEAVVRGTLDRFSERITRVDVYLSNESSDTKSGIDDMRCLLEASLVGLQPTVVSYQATTLEQAVDGAAGKLERSLETTFGRLDDRSGWTTATGG